MYLRRKCYSSNIDFDYLEDLALAEKIFSDDNRGLGLAIGGGAGLAGLGALYAVASSKDKAASQVLEAAKKGELSGKEATQLLTKLSFDDAKTQLGNLSADDLVAILGKHEAEKFTSSKANLKNYRLSENVRKALEKKGNAADRAAILDSIEASNKALRGYQRDLDLYKAGGNKNWQSTKTGKDLLKNIEEEQAKLAGYNVKLGKYNVDMDGLVSKRKSAEKAASKTLLKALRANPGLATAAGIGGVAGLAGLGYMAGDRR